MPVRILYYLSSFGSPNREFKQEILSTNLTILNKFAHVDLLANIYDDNFELPSTIQALAESYYSFHRRGMMAELWLANGFDVSGYDYVFLILDDVRLSPFFDLDRMIAKYTFFEFDIISPSINDSTNSYMNNMLYKSSQIFTAKTKYLEFFAYLMKPIHFERYLSVQDLTNPSTVGLDLLLDIVFDMNLGIDYEDYAYHLFACPSSSNELRTMQIDTFIGKHGFANRYALFKKHGFPFEQLVPCDSALIRTINTEKYTWRVLYENVNAVVKFP